MPVSHYRFCFWRHFTFLSAPRLIFVKHNQVVIVPVKTLQWLPSGDPDSSPWLTKPYMMWFLPHLRLLIWCYSPFCPLISSYPGHLVIFPLAKPFLAQPFPVSGILFLRDFACKPFFSVSSSKLSWRGLPRSFSLR